MHSVPGRIRALFGAVAVFLLNPAAAEEPWRLGNRLSTPDWLRVSGSYRLRYEWLDNSFRAVDPGTDNLLVWRLRLKAEARYDRFRAGVQLQDSRTWLEGTGTPLGTDDVNALEPIQMYVGVRGNNWLMSGDRVDITVGRFTMGMGSNRFIGEHIYRNTRDSSDGIRAIWTLDDGPRIQAFVTNPVDKLPGVLDRDGLRDADVEFDRDASTVFWGAHVDDLKLRGLDTELYVFGLDESDSSRRPTRNRSYLTTGFRLMEAIDDWAWEVELAYQFGEVRATPLPGDTTDLDHSAWMLHAHVGTELRGAWRPEIEFRYDYSSGDSRPGDGNNERFDSLYGPVRFDFGPTGIYGAIRRSNINSPGVYVNLHPAQNAVWMIGYRAAWLAERRDFFGASGVRDTTGNSGSFIGHQIETRYRWEILPGRFRFEAGGALLFKGEFLEDAPTAPPAGDTIYLYSQFLVFF